MHCFDYKNEEKIPVYIFKPTNKKQSIFQIIHNISAIIFVILITYL